MDAVARWCLSPFKLIFSLEHSFFPHFQFCKLYLASFVSKRVRKYTFKGRDAIAASIHYWQGFEKDQLYLIFIFLIFYYQNLEEKYFQLLVCYCLSYLLNRTIYSHGNIWMRMLSTNVSEGDENYSWFYSS